MATFGLSQTVNTTVRNHNMFLRWFQLTRPHNRLVAMSFAEFLVVRENVSALQRRKGALGDIFMDYLLIINQFSAIAGSPLQCWDNSTRGLDSATALDFVRTLRISTQLTGATALVTLYQTSQSIYEVRFMLKTVPDVLKFKGLRQSHTTLRRTPDLLRK